MSQLFFTSSLLSDDRFLSFEELFKKVQPSEIILIFDTNIVIDFREFYFNPKEFSKDLKFRETYFSARYLVEQIDRYDLEINAAFGIEESSRSIKDFSLNLQKAQQTSRALKDLFSMNIEKLDNHINKGSAENLIINNEEFPNTKIECLKETSTFQGLLIISYLASLKIYELTIRIEKKEKTHLGAMTEFLKFLDEEVDAISATFISYAFHIFGGFQELKPLIFSKEKKNLNKRLHKIFNGAIDLIFPNITDKSQLAYSNSLINTELIPVFVTRDKYISVLHSMLNTKVRFENETLHDPQLKEVSYKFIKMTNWNQTEKEIIESVIRQISIKRLSNSFSGQKSALPLLNKVEYYETIVKELF
ncbi:MAG: hypothetical protein V4549_18865 [Bacteroidota bacterium]